MITRTFTRTIEDFDYECETCGFRSDWDYEVEACELKHKRKICKHVNVQWKLNIDENPAHKMDYIEWHCLDCYMNGYKEFEHKKDEILILFKTLEDKGTT